MTTQPPQTRASPDTPSEGVNMDPRLLNKKNAILQKVSEYHPDPDLDMLERAIDFAAEMHSEQRRRNGDPYLSHPLEVTDIIADLKLDIAGLCAGMLHDVVEDTETTVEDISEMFNEDIAFIVDGVTKLSKYQFLNKQERQAESFRKMFLAMASDIRVILVKLSDRVHNMRTLKYMPPKKQREIAQETLDIYAPLAARLGIHWIKSELEDISFRYIYPDEYYQLAEDVSVRREERERYIQETSAILNEKLQEHGIHAQITGRPKHFYSIWKKMKAKGISFDEVHDALAFRVMPETVRECYEVLGVVHSIWRPVPGRFKDYVGLPKPNGYQSLHTSVIGPYGERVEIQIRTEAMHKVAEEGVAAHWQYKEGRMHPARDAEKFAWLRQLIEWQHDLADPKEFMDMVKVDMFSDEVYTLTPQGHIMSLPKKSTPVDFAFAIHTEVGNHCTGARVNGQIVPLKHELQNGDTVKILTHPNQRPNPDWLKFVQTSRARHKIRQHVRREQRERSRQYGKELLDKEFKRFGLSLRKLRKEGRFEDWLRACKCQNLDELYINIGYGKLQADTAIRKALPDEETEPKEQPEGRLGRLMRTAADKITGRKTGVALDGVEDVMVRYAKCCGPVPGEPIVGFVTRGRGLAIHAADCNKLQHMEQERFIDVYWEANAKSSTRPVTLRVYTEDRAGMLASITQTFTGEKINISEAHCRTQDDGSAINTFEVMIADSAQLKGVIKKIQGISGVRHVARVRV